MRQQVRTRLDTWNSGTEVIEQRYRRRWPMTPSDASAGNGECSLSDLVEQVALGETLD